MMSDLLLQEITQLLKDWVKFYSGPQVEDVFDRTWDLLVRLEREANALPVGSQSAESIPDQKEGAIKEVARIYGVDIQSLIDSIPLDLDLEQCEIRLEREQSYGVGGFEFVEMSGDVATIKTDVGDPSEYEDCTAQHILDAVIEALTAESTGGEDQ